MAASCPSPFSSLLVPWRSKSPAAVLEERLVHAGGLPREAPTLPLFSRRGTRGAGGGKVTSWRRGRNARPQLENESLGAASPGISPAPQPSAGQ